MVTNERKTIVKSIAFNNYLLEKADKLVKDGKFSSLSDLVFIAVTELLIKIELEQEKSKKKDLLLEILNNPECRLEIEEYLKNKISIGLNLEHENIIDVD